MKPPKDFTYLGVNVHALAPNTTGLRYAVPFDCEVPRMRTEDKAGIKAHIRAHIPKRTNKWLYGWALYVNYGQGWEYELFESTYAEYRENKRAYRENCTYPQKWSRRRELNPEWRA